MFKSDHEKYRIHVRRSLRQRSRANITLLALKLLILISIIIVIYYVGIIAQATLNQIVQSIAHSLLHDLFRLIQ
jgi:membrane-anchored glycerophosphoryl diester phosphodiesterase (GDPDase)